MLTFLFTGFSTAQVARSAAVWSRHLICSFNLQSPMAEIRVLTSAAEAFLYCVGGCALLAKLAKTVYKATLATTGPFCRLSTAIPSMNMMTMRNHVRAGESRVFLSALWSMEVFFNAAADTVPD